MAETRGKDKTVPTDLRDSNDFELRIDFVPSKGEPTRIFEAMTQLIRAVQSMDEELCKSLGKPCSSRLVLEDVTSGSLLARFTEIVEDLPDEALRNAEWKKIIGHFLIKAKYAFLEWSNKRKKITGRAEVVELQKELMDVAQETGLKLLPAYAPIPIDRVVIVVQRVQTAIAILDVGETASINSILGMLPIQGGLSVPDSIVQELVTSEVLESEGIRIVKVKKPDFIGRSMWSLRYGDATIDAHMHDVEWLQRFQNALEPVLPGDSLRVRMKERVYYGYQGDIVQRQNEILEVIEVIKPQYNHQVELFEEGPN